MTDHAFINRQHVIRHAMLAELYSKCQISRIGAGGYSRDLTHTLGHDPQECEFALGYLVEAGLVIRESVHCRITALGMEKYEAESCK
ncbi:hypothetical protein [Pseudomonas fontis]|uniref:Uncharacterized protein n=1 Tax=Pseudomonas fontis TaxID=2942633 RepID=A0ABT5NXK7_9PSED|nr:hypothetical protein [Pseudomonas fontis]MDD0973807.1 hypothetical protein [Pseudomonas fontis]MDD0992941.1 hypothetical protein [Pseudomonas fontis]